MEPVPGHKIRDIEPSAYILVFKKDSSRVEGDFDGVGIVSAESASVWYAREDDSRGSDSSLLSYGQPITLKVHPADGGPTCWGTFYGVDTWNLCWKDRISARVMKIPFEHVITLTYGDNNVVAGSDLPALIRQEGMPNIGAIRLTSLPLVPLREVARVEVKASKNAQTTGLLIGLAVDCAAVIAGLIVLTQLQSSGLGGLH